MKRSLADPVKGPGWLPEYCDRVHEEYLRFLTLKKEFPGEVIVPSQSIDEFWHRHILDTKQYASDCQRAIGRFVDHDPYFGADGPEDEITLATAWKRLHELYWDHFREIPPEDVWRVPIDCG